MHIVVIFYNIGGYHAARLRGAAAAAQEKGWRVSALQITDSAQEHPWGEVKHGITFPMQTVLPAEKVAEGDRDPYSSLAAKRLPNFLTSLNPDAVAIPGWGFPYARAALKWCRRHQVPAILMSESKWDDEPRQWWKEWLKSQLYVKQFRTALVGAETHRQYLIQLGMPVEAIALGYDIVDNDYFAAQADIARQDPTAARSRQPQIPQRPYFITVSRFIPRKNLQRLLSAYAMYRQQCVQQPWDLVVCGSGKEEASLKQAIAEHDLESWVHLPGFVSYNAMGDWYGLATGLIHPALQEQWGLVVNEAMAAGLPVLVSASCGCAPELVQDGLNGFRFDPTNVEQLANLMQALSEGPIDAKNLGQAAQAQLQSMGPTAFGAGLVKAVTYACSQS